MAGNYHGDASLWPRPECIGYYADDAPRRIPGDVDHRRIRPFINLYFIEVGDALEVRQPDRFRSFGLDVEQDQLGKRKTSIAEPFYSPPTPALPDLQLQLRKVSVQILTYQDLAKCNG